MQGVAKATAGLRRAWGLREELEGALIIHGILELQPAGLGAVQGLLPCTHCALKGMLHISSTSTVSPDLLRTVSYH